MLLLAASFTIWSLYRGSWSHKLLNLERLQNWVNVAATQKIKTVKPTKSSFGAQEICLLRILLVSLLNKNFRLQII